MFPVLIEKLKRQEDLTTDEAAAAMAVIMRGEAAPAQIAGLLIGLGGGGMRATGWVILANALSYLAVIARDPEHVRRALERGPP